MEQRIIVSAIAENVYIIDSINDLSSNKVYIQCFKEVPGLSGIDVIIDDTNESSSSSYNHTEHTIFSKDGLCIKTDYKLSNNMNDDGFYVTNINKSDFIKLSHFHV